MKKLLLITLCVFTSTFCMAQTPGWAGKAKKSVFSIITYDNDDKIKSTGNGFYIDEKGTGVSDYTLFKGAKRAVIVDADGKQYPVDCILGANEIYDVVKFRVKADKATPALAIAKNTPEKGATIYLLPYSTQKQTSLQNGKVEEVTDIEGGHKYYTLQLNTTDKMVSCPVTNANGEAIGLIQNAASNTENSSYAIGVSFASGLSINALSGGDYVLNNIGIKKGFPEKEDQALVYIYMIANSLNVEEYINLLNEFLIQFPNSSEGYLRRATAYIDHYKDNEHYALAENDIEKALEKAEKKDDMLYNLSKVYLLSSTPEFTYKDWNGEKALQTIQQAITINPLPIYIQQEGDIYYALKNYEKAFESYDKVNHSDMVSEISLFSAARAKQMAGAKEEALALMDSTVAHFGKILTAKAAPYIFQRAQMRADMKMYRPAIADYNEYYRLLGGKVSALFYFSREQAEMQTRMYQQALDDIEKAVEIAPEEPVYLIEMTSVYIRFNRLDDAINAAKKGITLAPENPDFYRMLGYCQAQTGQKEEGKKNLLKAKELGDPNADMLIEKYCK